MQRTSNKIRATLLETWRRIVSIGERDNKKIYQNGENNLYPNDVEAIIDNSPTAFRCAKLMAKYVAGSGVLDEFGNVIEEKDLPTVNSYKGYKITDIIESASRSISYQYGVFFHVGYYFDEMGNLKKSLSVLDYSKCRISKEDDEDYPGKIYYRDWEKKESPKDNKLKWFYPYHPKEDVVFAQIRKDYGKDLEEDDELIDAIQSYRGQVFYLNLNPEKVYASSLIDSVYNDADTEYRLGLFLNNHFRNGLLGKLMVITQGLDEEIAEQVKKDLTSFLGAENTGSLWHLDVEKAEDITKLVHVQQIKAEVDDKILDTIGKGLKKNIIGTFGIPDILIMMGNDGLLGTNPDTYLHGKVSFSEQVEEERAKLEKALAYLGFPTRIKPIAVAEPKTIENAV